LQGEYSIEVQYLVKTPEKDIARYALAGQAKEMGLDMETILSDIMEVQDPKKMLQRASLQRMREMHPEFDTYLAAIDMANMEMPEAAKILAAKAGIAFDTVLAEAKQMQAMQQAQQMPAMPAGGGGSQTAQDGPQKPGGGQKQLPIQLPKLVAGARNSVPQKPRVRVG
jgi:hypothetical protein